MPEYPEAASELGEQKIRVDLQHVVLLTQSCDLAIRADGSCSATDVLLAGVFFKHELNDHKQFSKPHEWNNAKKGRYPSYHVLNECRLEGCELDFMVVDLSRIYTATTKFVREIAAKKGTRVRLLPPYREHLSQAFARFFMRVGLPVDLPDFK